MNATNRHSSGRTLSHLHNLFFTEKKPADLRPIDMALLTYLMLRQTEDHFINDSQLTLANRLGCERRTIAESIERLCGMGWIVRKTPRDWNEKTHRNTRSIGKPAGLSLNMNKLPKPADRTKHSSPSQDAVNLAAHHTTMLKNLQTIKRQPKGFGKQQEYAAQRIIDQVGGFQLAASMIQFAINDPRFRNAAYKSLYEIRTRLRAIKLAYDAAQRAVAA